MTTIPARRHKGRRGNCALLALLCAALASPAFAATKSRVESVFPPWQHGKNNDASDRGLEFTVPQIDVLADFHGDLTDPKLVLFVGGNYFFVMAPLVQAFETTYPEYKGSIYWETIPPGLLINQMKAGGRITAGNMTWKVMPDAYFAGLKKIDTLIADGTLAAPAVTRPTTWVSERPMRSSFHTTRASPSRATSSALAKPGRSVARPEQTSS